MTTASSAAAAATTQPDQLGSDFAELSRTIREAGLLRRRYGYYALHSGLSIVAFVGAWVVFGFLGDSWWQLLVAAFVALVSTQLSFTGHDAGHKQIFRGKRANDAIGLLHGGLTGLSYGWWIAKHNRHHANPNHEDDDPDLDISALAFTKGQGLTKVGLTRWIAKYQAFLFFPLLLLEGINLHVSSITAVWRGQTKAGQLEKVLLAVHVVAYLTAVFVVLSPGKAVLFIVVHQCVWGVYMGCSFAPNHKGMATMTKGHTLDFLRKQVLTSRNVSGGRWVDITLGGLNFQIEHHLFPNMPRPNLRRAQPIVRDYCRAKGIDYAECGVFRSYATVLAHLHAVGAPLRQPAVQQS
jgi:fatty acid desaturase